MRPHRIVIGMSVCALGLLAGSGLGCGSPEEGSIDLSASKRVAAERGISRDARPSDVAPRKRGETPRPAERTGRR